ncbi:MAG: pyridoxamine 5'-phosphate oxidase [Halioglobus sp.]|nr:pyridoxamine 5'-phosphate oxidase [Halioglobus sp.]
MSYEEFRREYTAGGLQRSMLDHDPLRQFEQWLAQAVEAGVEDPTAMVLATVDAQGLPWQRIVLFKGFSKGGFVFYTNQSSNKAQDIARQPVVSLLFPWNELDRQIILRGQAEKLSTAESAAYFVSRPRKSQIAAWASKQSRPLSARAVLEQQFNAIRDKFENGVIPMPDFWGGYRVVPQQLEFWQGRRSRMHDRFRYYRESADDWRIERLQP